MKKNFLGRFLGLTALMFTLLFTTASAEVYEGEQVMVTIKME